MKICVQGLWHLGSVTAACLASVGHDVVGLDGDSNNISNLNQGKAPLFEPGLDEMIQNEINEGHLHFAQSSREALADGGMLLSEKCIGIIGCGHIGTDLVHLLQPFNCRIMICDILDKREVVETYGVNQVSLDELLAEADIVSLHVPLTEMTHFMVDEAFFHQMKPSAYLINNSRGPIVKQEALKKVLQQKIIAGAALDVYESEPPEDLESLSLPNLMVTPHIGGNADEAVLAMGRSAINHLKRFFADD